MKNQKLFKTTYLETLKNGIDIHRYQADVFDYEDSQLLSIPTIIQPSNLSDRLAPLSDFETAVRIYEAYKELNPLQASDERLWTYLTHVDLYPYMIKRWGGVQLEKAEKPDKYILDHWFLKSSVQSDLLRHAIAGLWWGVYLSVDESRESDKYGLTKILFRQLDFPTRTLGTYALGRHKEAVIGILEFIEEEEELFKHKFEAKTRFLTKHLNLIGGVKPLAYFGRDFFKMELKKVTLSLKSV